MAEGQPLQDPSKAPLQGETFQHAEPPPPYQQQGQKLVNYSIHREQETLSYTGIATHLSDPSWQQQPQPVPLATAPPPQQNVRVVVTAPVFGEKPVRLQCPNCHADIRTAVESRSSKAYAYLNMQWFRSIHYPRVSQKSSLTLPHRFISVRGQERTSHRSSVAYLGKFVVHVTDITGSIRNGCMNVSP